MLRLASTVALCAAAIGWAPASSAQGPKDALKTPAGAAGVLSRPVLQALGSFRRAVEAEDTAGCPVGDCPAGDQACRQSVFHAVVGCLSDGRLRALPDCPDCAWPGAAVTLFRAHGDE